MVRTPAELSAYVEGGALDVYQPDAVLAVGILRARELAERILPAGLWFTPHTWTNGIGLLANLHLSRGRRRRAVHRAALRPARLDAGASRLHADRACPARPRMGRSRSPTGRVSASSSTRTRSSGTPSADRAHLRHPPALPAPAARRGAPGATHAAAPRRRLAGARGRDVPLRRARQRPRRAPRPSRPRRNRRRNHQSRPDHGDGERAGPAGRLPRGHPRGRGGCGRAPAGAGRRRLPGRLRRRMRLGARSAARARHPARGARPGWPDHVRPPGASPPPADRCPRLVDGGRRLHRADAGRLLRLARTTASSVTRSWTSSSRFSPAARRSSSSGSAREEAIPPPRCTRGSTSTRPRTAPARLRCALETVGAARLVYGSDRPVVDAAPTLEALAALGDGVLDTVRSENPGRLFA